MKRFLLFGVFLLFLLAAKAQPYPHPMPAYTPTEESQRSRIEFQDMKFGMFIHWGIYSELGDGEWVMNNKKIPYNDYKRLADFFNPLEFNAKEWVQLAKAAGMKYITITSRHHDGFSMFHTKASPYNIVDATPYKKDPIRELAEECQKEGIKLHFYYSLLDWGRSDYGFNKPIVNAAPSDTDWESYIRFMKTQLTELLTNYPSIGAIWFDGHWQRPGANWHYDEIYSLIHKLSPKALIGNNHHIAPIAGEDIQMFEKDLPGENKAGHSAGSTISSLPLETCETMNNSWGFNINDRKYKSVKDIIHYMVNAAGRNANFLLNVGPMPNGKIQPEFTDTLKAVGVWMKKYGASIYGTRGNIVAPQDWGVVTAKEKLLYVHVLNQPKEPYLFIPSLKEKVISASLMEDDTTIKFKQQPEGLFIYTNDTGTQSTDRIIRLKIQ
jgi:alpha-L-fucosidase